MKPYTILLFAFSLLANSLAENDTSTATSTSTSSPASSTIPTSQQPSTSPTTTEDEYPVPREPTWEVPQWSVKSPNSTCVLLRGNFTFAVTYTTASGNTATDQVDIPGTASTSGACGPFLNTLVLTWEQGNLTFMFIKKPIFSAGMDTGNGAYSLTTIFGRLTVKNPNEPGSTSPSPSTTINNNTGGNGNDFPSPPNDDKGRAGGGGQQTFYIRVREPGGLMTTSQHNSYSCRSYQYVAADSRGSVFLEMRDVQLEAFHEGPSDRFSPSEPCTKDTVSSLMSIVGYVGLAALIVAAVGYLAWRQFGRAGYTEV